MLICSDRFANTTKCYHCEHVYFHPTSLKRHNNILVLYCWSHCMHAHLPGMIFQYIFITQEPTVMHSLNHAIPRHIYKIVKGRTISCTYPSKKIGSSVTLFQFFQSVIFEVYPNCYIMDNFIPTCLLAKMSSQWIWRMFAESKVWKVLRLKFLRHRPPQFDPSSIGTSEDSSFQWQNWIFEIWNEYVFKYSIWEDTVYKKQY